MLYGNSLDTLFAIKECKSRRVSSYDRSGGNHDWVDVEPGCTHTINVEGAGIIRHIWCTLWVGDEAWTPEKDCLRKVILRMYWDGEAYPSVEVPIGDFFGIGHGICKNFISEPFMMSPEDGRAFNCFFPMPFGKGARISVTSECENHMNLYYYIDYEEYEGIDESFGRFHSQWRRESNTSGWAEKQPGILDKEKAGVLSQPAWYPKMWMKNNTDGEDNYVILDAEGKGHYVGCNLNIDVFERQANDWYGEGDDMIFIDGESWPPRLHGTGTEDYFNTAFCPTQEYNAPWHGVTLYSGDKAGFKWGGKNSVYRYHIKDPIRFEKSIKVTIEHGHANKLSNDYSSTAYWYQTEPHKVFPAFPELMCRLPRKNDWEK